MQINEFVIDLLRIWFSPFVGVLKTQQVCDPIREEPVNSVPASRESSKLAFMTVLLLSVLFDAVSPVIAIRKGKFDRNWAPVLCSIHFPLLSYAVSLTLPIRPFNFCSPCVHPGSLCWQSFCLLGHPCMMIFPSASYSSGAFSSKLCCLHVASPDQSCQPEVSVDADPEACCPPYQVLPLFHLHAPSWSTLCIFLLLAALPS